MNMISYGWIINKFQRYIRYNRLLKLKKLQVRTFIIVDVNMLR